MLLRIYFPPEFLREVLSAHADLLQMIQVHGRDAFQNLPHTRHGKRGEPVSSAREVQMSRKEPHELASFGLTRLRFLGKRYQVAYVLHNRTSKKSVPDCTTIELSDQAAAFGAELRDRIGAKNSGSRGSSSRMNSVLPTETTSVSSRPGYWMTEYIFSTGVKMTVGPQASSVQRYGGGVQESVVAALAMMRLPLTETSAQPPSSASGFAAVGRTACWINARPAATSSAARMRPANFTGTMIGDTRVSRSDSTETSSFQG